MILSVEDFKTNYLCDKAKKLFPVEGDQDSVDDNAISVKLEASEIRVSLDTGFDTLPENKHFKYAVAMYCMAERVSGGIVKLHSESDSYVNTYYANYKNAIRRLRRKTHGWCNLEWT